MRNTSIKIILAYTPILLVIVILFLPITSYVKLSVLFLIIDCLIMSTVYLVHKRVQNGFELNKDIFIILSNELGYLTKLYQELIEVIKTDPRLLKEIETRESETKQFTSRLFTLKEANKKIADIEELKDRMINLEKNLSPFRISLYAIFVGISVAVGLGLIGILLLKVPLPK